MFDPGHHLSRAAIIPNDVPWYILAVSIVIAGALISYGAQLTSERWEKDADLPKWFSVAGGIIGNVLATLLGGVLGHMIFHWSIGLLCGFVGGLSSQVVLGFLAARLGGILPVASPVPVQKKDKPRTLKKGKKK